MRNKSAEILIGAALCALTSLVLAAGASVTINQVDEKGVGKSLGTVKIEDSKEGLVVMTDLKGLAPGHHGFHVHENANCYPKEKDGKMVAGLAAGAHYDPGKTGKHEGPKGMGHLGDLPPLVVDKDGNAKVRLVAPRLKVADLNGRALMIHEGGDNFSDTPKPLGGGGNRIACGVIK
jgi:Cu-Zn family superoxide dismutase